MAVRVDGRPSFSCVVRFLSSPAIILRSLKLRKVTEGNGGSQGEDIKGSKSTEVDDKYEGDVTICKNQSDFMNLNDPSSPCALLKAVCVVLGVVERSGKSSNPHDNKNEVRNMENNANIGCFSRRLAACGACGLEIVCCSELPSGSGKTHDDIAWSQS